MFICLCFTFLVFFLGWVGNPTAEPSSFIQAWDWRDLAIRQDRGGVKNILLIRIRMVKELQVTAEWGRGKNNHTHSYNWALRSIEVENQAQPY